MIFDLHIHSTYSHDSFLSPEAIINTAKKKGLSGVAVTDHGTIKGGLITKEVNNDDPDFTVIVGSELETEFGDVIGLFLDREVLSRNFIGVCDEIKAQGGLTVLAHPYRKGKPPADELIKWVDLIEGFNSRSSRKHNLKAQEFARVNGIPMVAGSDAHLSYEIGRGRTLLKTGTDLFKHSEESLTIQGEESQYYLVHGMSIIMEQIKRILGNR